MTVISLDGHLARKRLRTKDALAKRGAMSSLSELVRQLLRVRRIRRERPPDVSTLSTRMRRDVGLLPDVDVVDRYKHF